MATLSLELTRLLNKVQMRLPGALDSAVKIELFDVLDEFFKGSNIWTEDIDVDVDDTTDTYDVVPTDDGQINRLIGIVNSDSVPVYGDMAIPGTLILRNTPSQEETFTVKVALTVVDPVRTDGWAMFPDWIMLKYGADFAEGVLGKMMSQPNKPYTNERLAIYHLRRWQGAIATARSEARRANVFRGQSWRFPAFSHAGRA